MTTNHYACNKVSLSYTFLKISSWSDFLYLIYNELFSIFVDLARLELATPTLLHHVVFTSQSGLCNNRIVTDLGSTSIVSTHLQVISNLTQLGVVMRFRLDFTELGQFSLLHFCNRLLIYFKVQYSNQIELQIQLVLLY